MAQQRDIETRAVALAVIQLTRNPRLFVTQAASGPYDLDVRIVRDNQPSECTFAVEVKGLVRATTDTVNERLRSRTGATWKQFFDGPRFRALHRPLMLMVFTADSERGFYGWVDEPRITGSRAELVHKWPPRMAEWSKYSAQQILEAVDRWWMLKQSTA